VRRLRRRRPPVTLCVLTYGNYPQLARRCVESILRYGDRRRYELVVGGNAVSPRTLRYLIGLQENGVIDRLHLSPHNLFKNPMMRRMFSAIDTEFIWWFDDDSYMVEPGALDRWLRTARRSASAVAAWGQVYFYRDHTEFSLGSDVREFVRTAPWFRGKELPSARVKPGDRSSRDAPSASDGRWFFPTGGCWLARTAAIRALDWPDRRLLLPADDVFFGEAIRQQGWRVCDVGSLGVAINQSPTRWREKRRLMRRQMAAMNRGAG
jgi:GT2 family glycosyltransferase